MNEQVLTALEVLRNFAENDFEKHRIDVLEKDLTEPPKVEIIDEMYQRFDGVSYCKGKGGHYVKGVSIHQAVYCYYFGEIPKRYHIHHKDGNKSNNDISNLQMLTESQHHKLHGLLVKMQSPTFRKICSVCGKEFFVDSSHTRQKYCSRECYYKFKTKMPIEKVCVICGKKFFTTRKANKKCCSRICANIATGKSLRKEPLYRKCVFCGKEFTTRREKQLYCCVDCAINARAEYSKKVKRKYSGLKMNKFCLVCGKGFVTRYKSQKYCSRECYYNSRRK